MKIHVVSTNANRFIKIKQIRSTSILHNNLRNKLITYYHNNIISLLEGFDAI